MEGIKQAWNSPAIAKWFEDVIKSSFLGKASTICVENVFINGLTGMSVGVADDCSRLLELFIYSNIHL